MLAVKQDIEVASFSLRGGGGEAGTFSHTRSLIFSSGSVARRAGIRRAAHGTAGRTDPLAVDETLEQLPEPAHDSPLDRESHATFRATTDADS